VDLAGKLRQTATYWAPSGSTDRYGKPTLAAPVQVSCRWEDKTSAVISKKGEEIISKSRVYLIQDIDIDGFLFLGTSASTDPASIDDAHEIQAVSKTPDLSNLQSLTTVYL
jgi:hypothetical protein